MMQLRGKERHPGIMSSIDKRHGTGFVKRRCSTCATVTQDIRLSLGRLLHRQKKNKLFMIYTAPYVMFATISAAVGIPAVVGIMTVAINCCYMSIF
jgi:hypothetical protein